MNIKLPLITATAALLLSACASSPTYHTNPETRNAMIGGATLGAVIGGLSQADGGDRGDIGRGAAIGAAVGAGAGYAVTR